MHIVGYIHVCQTGEWRRVLDMIFTELRQSGLYDVTSVINCCVVTDTVPDTSFANDKCKILVKGRTALYERPTLLHLRDTADDGTLYWYVHTKGLRWFGTPSEQNVMHWVRYMMYFDFTRWQDAVASLTSGYDTYGTDFSLGPNPHYSGNFWWARGSYIKKLPTSIGSGYFDPEFWIGTASPKAMVAHTCSVNPYHDAYPPERYRVY